MKNKFSTLNLMIFGIILLIIIATSTYFYGESIVKQLSLSTNSTINEISQLNEHVFNLELESEIDFLHDVSRSLAVFKSDFNILTSYISSLVHSNDFNNLYVVDTAGEGINTYGIPVNVADYDFFKKSLLGNAMLTHLVDSPLADEMVNIFSIPLIIDSEIVGVIALEYEKKHFNKYLNNTFNDSGYSFIINSKGNIIASSDNKLSSDTDTIFTVFENATFRDNNNLDKILSDISNKIPGNVNYSINSNNKLAAYSPLTYGDWSIITIIPHDIVAYNANNIINDMNVLIIIILIGCISFFITVINLRDKSIKEIENAAYYDYLTGLPNVNKFKISVNEILEKNKSENFSIVKIDIVNFKAINEVHNFEIGNDVICAVSKVGFLIDEKPFIMSRVGTDEFLVFTTANLARKIEENRANYHKMFVDFLPAIISKQKIDFRYGRYFLESQEKNINAMIDKVMLAHSHTKNIDNMSICDYDSNFKQRLINYTLVSNKMEDALKNKEFKVFLQPKYHTESHKLSGFEALVRWIDNGKIIPPSDFIRIFEQNGFICELDKYMLEETCKLLKSWMNEGFSCVPISVNYSRIHILSDNFLNDIENIVKKYNIPPKLIEIEFTESTIFENEDALETIISKLHEKGFTISMDDFGSGYSSLGLLRTFPVDIIKLDKSFVDGENNKLRGEIIIEAIIQMAEKLNISTVAEGVETELQMQFLKKVGCNMIQGYYFSKPMPAEEVKGLLYDHQT